MSRRAELLALAAALLPEVYSSYKEPEYNHNRIAAESLEVAEAVLVALDKIAPAEGAGPGGVITLTAQQLEAVGTLADETARLVEVVRTEETPLLGANRSAHVHGAEEALANLKRHLSLEK